uniref:Uncharacterized protein n=1 Tax=Candidatus Kentrum sp. TUN TaxID=2126343 RepID=A0A450ZXF8_9GAMM|nr:MAG: hypothetical protein BECKTUN1418F_GA0071002_11455 [Candidatus Kentron sp. TUN]VFK61634.1 MAG: hypothetical protein BECKTUN1418D_GA0071000_11567 [Candidatus Kentron sp. TUN]VFK67354.1 MAG: hypothetical protein BECKTUN1418E_GA0071001_11435 [Candidatus Kentron sp. TUN]
MKITPHTAREYADAIRALLPPGKAWEWPEGGLGDSLLLGTAEELARVDAATQGVLDNAIEIHRPMESSWHISEYQRVAEEALMNDNPEITSPGDFVQIAHLFGPARIGSHIGDRLWGTRSRYVLLVCYDPSEVDPAPLLEALEGFKQAHVFLWPETL